MFIIKINPYGVQEIFLQSENDLLEDISLAIWPLCRKHLTRLDRDLKKFSMRFCEQGEKIAASPSGGRS